jgi:hypothetical protein
MFYMYEILYAYILASIHIFLFNGFISLSSLFIYMRLFDTYIIVFSIHIY